MKFNNEIADKIYNILQPIVGTTMSEVSIGIHAKKIGTLPESLDRSHLPKIADNIKKSLVVFLGTDGAANISQKIRNIT